MSNLISKLNGVVMILLFLSVLHVSTPYENRNTWIGLVSVYVEKRTVSKNINDLLNESSPLLKLRVGNESFYPVSNDLSLRILENFKDYQVVHCGNIDKPTPDVVMKYEGYGAIKCSTEDALFWFDDDDEEIYSSRQIVGLLWNRCILEDVNGRVQYTHFQKETLAQHSEIDNNSNQCIDILLYYDGDIRLSINDEDYVISKSVDSTALEYMLEKNHYDLRLDFIRANDGKLEHVLAGYRYSFVNHYRTTSQVKAFSLGNESSREEWSINELLRRKLIVKTLDENNLILHIDGTHYDLKCDLTEGEADRMMAYSAALVKAGKKFIGHSELQFFSNLTNYSVEDYDNDGDMELLCFLYMRGGAAALSREVVAVYEFGNDVVCLKQIYPLIH